MISYPTVARNLSELLLDFSKRLDESVFLVQQNCPAEEFKAYRLAIGKILAEVLLEALNQLYAKHPNIKPQGLD